MKPVEVSQSLPLEEMILEKVSMEVLLDSALIERRIDRCLWLLYEVLDMSVIDLVDP